MDIFQNATYDIYLNWTNSSLPIDSLDNTSLFLSDSHIGDGILESSPLQVLQEPSLATVVCLALLLGIVILTTVVGNLFVLTAILRDRNLQTVSNYLVFSLAIADLMVACLVMPMGAQYEVMNQQWVLGAILCELWTSADVLCCTASILHLVAIAVDRFRAVTSIDYVQHRNTRRVGIMIALVWGVAFLVSFAPILGWKDDKFLYRIQEENR
ncbi:5-hydroxytryptamine receptor 2A [Trichonephila clavata]|uniref:5-hydroxytryptamine receptor 2A n=1 Tax=Trichonephila clavata TaxID=2740835 RepID=A0A8X6F023_TRICU|nr:5-hydroxytryptamine receptor 2A [Trichonephila clavata]